MTETIPRELAGLIVCGSPSNNPGAGPGKALAKLLTLFYGERHRSSLVQKMAFGSYNRGIELPESPNSWICANPQTVSDYDRDPLCGFVFTLNGFTALFTLVQQVYRPQNWQVSNPQMPVHDQTHSHRLDPSAGQTALDLFPQEGAELVAHNPVQDPPGCLEVYK